MCSLTTVQCGATSSISARFKDVYYVGKLLCIRCYEQEYLPRFIYYFLSSDYGYKAIQNHVRGVHLIASEARKILVPLASLDEQRCIVAAIEEQFSRLDAGVAALKWMRANLKRYRTAVLKAAVEGRLTEAWREENPDVEPASELLERILQHRRERWEQNQLAAYAKKGKKPPKNWQSKYKEPPGPDMNDLPKLPERWRWASLEQCSYRITDGTHQPPAFVHAGVLFVFVKHIVGDSISFEDTKFISEATYRRLNSRCPVEVGDII